MTVQKLLTTQPRFVIDDILKVQVNQDQIFPHYGSFLLQKKVEIERYVITQFEFV